MTTTANFVGGPGTFTILDDAPAQIALLTAAVNAQTIAFNLAFGASGMLVPGSPINSLSASVGVQAQIASSLKELDKRLQELTVSMGEMQKQMKVTQTGLASMSNHMAQQVTTAQQAYADQAKNNAFQQKTTNQALADANKPQTVIAPAEFLTRVQQNIQEVSTIKAETAATNLVTSYISNTTTSGFNTAVDWLAKSALGTFVIDTWASIKLKVTSLYSAEKVKETADNATLALLTTKAGATPPTNIIT
jgi:hypothetical protein